MSDTCNLDRLEALAYGELDGSDAERVREHARGCRSCERELAWLEGERALMQRRAEAEEPLPASLWAGVEAGIRADRGAAPTTADDAGAAPPPKHRQQAVRAHRRRRARPARRWIGVSAAAAAAAAALALTLWPGGGPAPAPQPVAESPADASGADPDELAEARRALAEAERAHVNAIGTLRSAYEARRGQLDPQVASRYDQRFEAAAELIASGQETAPDDIQARWLLLDAYSAHRRSLQGVLQEIEE